MLDIVSDSCRLRTINIEGTDNVPVTTGKIMTMEELNNVQGRAWEDVDVSFSQLSGRLEAIFIDLLIQHWCRMQEAQSRRQRCGINTFNFLAWNIQSLCSTTNLIVLSRTKSSRSNDDVDDSGDDGRDLHDDNDLSSPYHHAALEQYISSCVLAWGATPSIHKGIATFSPEELNLTSPPESLKDIEILFENALVR